MRVKASVTNGKIVLEFKGDDRKDKRIYARKEIGGDFRNVTQKELLDALTEGGAQAKETYAKSIGVQSYTVKGDG